MPLDAGRRLGTYEIIEPIGAGGMGEVYRARDTKLGRDVAIKVLPEAVAGSPERLARFEREAQLLASLNHPNIATVHGLEEADGLAYLVMELVPGETLAEILERGPIPVDEAVVLLRQIVDGLEAAHEKGVVHRDLKPANIKVTPDGVVRILDFGLAKVFETEGVEVASSLSPTLTRDATQAGVILGTAAYMSPEQARGKPVDKRSDIFSFGSVLFEMLSGRRPFEGEMVSDVLAAVIKTEPDWSKLPSSLPASIGKLVRRCLEKDPRRRLRDIGDARPELEETSTPEPVRSVDSKRTLGLGLAVGLAAGIAVALGLAGVFSLPAPRDVTRFAVVLPPATRFVALSNPGLALSPDGSKLVFRSASDLVLRRMDREETERIPGTAGGRSPFFSPDGEWIGFVADGQLKKASLSGGPSVTICATPGFWGADWGADDAIVFADRASGVWRVSADGGEPELVVENDGMAIGYPELIGDGKLLFVDLGRNASPEQSHIVAASIESGERKRLNLRGTQPRYLASGHLVFVDQGLLTVVPFDPETMEVGGAPVALMSGIVVSNMRLAAQYDVSNSGTLAYLDNALTRKLAWVDRRGDTLSMIADGRAFVDVRFSPDGTKVAVSERASDVDIWVYDVARETSTRMSYSPANDEVPVWSPDGRFVAWTSSGSVLQRAADGSGSEEALWQTPYHTHVAEWIADGKTFVVNEDRPDTGWDVLVLNFEGEPSPKYLLESSFDERNPRLHPEGKWLAYESDESGGYEIYVTSFPEPGARHRISSGGGVEPVWSADGNELYYRGPAEVFAVKVGGGSEFSAGKPVALFSDVFDRSGTTNHLTYDVHPDGRFLFVARPLAAEDDPYGRLYRFKVVVNWMAEVEARVPAP